MASEPTSNEELRAKVARLENENQQLRQRIAHLEEQRWPRRTSARDQDVSRYQTLFEQLPVSLCIFRSDGKLCDTNHQTETWRDMPREISVVTENLLHDQEADKRGLSACFQQTLQEQRPGSITARYDPIPSPPDGPPEAPLWIEHTFFPIADAEGTVSHVGQISINVTERVQKEATQRQNQVLLQGLIDNIPSVLYCKTVQGHFLLANQSMAFAMGASVEQLIGAHDSDYAPPDVIESWRDLTRQVLESGGPVQREEVFWQDDGPHTYLSVQFPLFDESGTLYAIGGMATDISERQQMETELRSSRSMLQGILDHAPMGIFTKDTQGTFLMMNRAAAEMIQLDGAEIIGKRDRDLFPEAYITPWREQDEQILTSGKPLFLEEEAPVGADVHSFLTVKFPIYENADTPSAICTMITDITERKRAEQEHAALQQQIINAQRDALRELSTPLIPIAEHVVIMPLIGTIDSTRAQLVMETLLEGVAQHQADLVILDITGVSVVDTQVAQAFVQAAQAVRLLGAQVMLTGIQPQIAQTLVSLGADLGGLITRGSLQAGIAAAMGR